ncbi:hypothetical protein PI125_g19669 [Phytophthora idaei]|nr:hypothetical protein PI125_g19669 [Phytophthora idaei]KAG3133599.1 hypothetical protein PI126_g19094 [Phytophthora idaei]
MGRWRHSEKEERSRLERQATLFAKEVRRKVTRTTTGELRTNVWLTTRDDMITGKLVRYRNSSGLSLIPIRGTVRWEKPCLRWTARTTKASGCRCGSGDSDYEEKPRVRTNDSSGDDSSGDMDGGESDRVSCQSLAGVSVDADCAVVELSQGEIAHIESTASTESKSNAH